MWFATLGEIAEHVRRQQQSEPGSVRVDRLPYYTQSALDAAKQGQQ